MRPSILRSAGPVRGGLYHRLWKTSHHVSPTKPRANQGYFHSRSVLGAGGMLNKRSETGANLRSTNGWPNKFFMITSSAPSITKYKDIIDQLLVLMNTPSVDVRQRKSPGIVILATPTFATWLENKEFMGTVLETIFPNTLGDIRVPKLDVTALMAVVDGLPSTGYNDMDKITEGFAFLPCDSQVVLPDLWHEENDARLNHSSYTRSCITFKLRPNAGAGDGLDIGIPLANTMFRNGRTSTLLASKWNRTDATDTFKSIKQVNQISATIYPTTSNSIIPLRLEIPLVPLTPLRRVVSGLGNILRQVADEYGNVTSASQELEASVDSYLESRLRNKQTVAVWALIIPDAIVMNEIGDSTIASNSEQIRASWTDKADSSMGSYVGNLIQKGSGATLHRVRMCTSSSSSAREAQKLTVTVSGGGGWGLKQGLLSLDPETRLLHPDEKNYDFTSSDSVDTNQIQALGNIAKLGSWVQFLMSDNLPSDPTGNESDYATAEPGFELADNMFFGCIASTVDDIPQPSSDPSAPSHTNESQYSVNSFYGKFGATSESGIFICATQNGVVISSKIDVPNSNLHLAAINGKQ